MITQRRYVGGDGKQEVEYSVHDGEALFYTQTDSDGDVCVLMSKVYPRGQDDLFLASFLRSERMYAQIATQVAARVYHEVRNDRSYSFIASPLFFVAPAEKLLTTKEVAERYRVSKGTIRKWVLSCHIPFVQANHATRFKESDLLRWEERGGRAARKAEVLKGYDAATTANK